MWRQSTASSADQDDGAGNRRRQLTCNAICPGYVYTPLSRADRGPGEGARPVRREQSIATAPRAAAEQALRHRRGSARCRVSASDPAASITGTALPVDGGWTATDPRAHANSREDNHGDDVKRAQTVLVLQGGGALGAYQAGVYQALHEGGIEPDWIIGTSIGAINASLMRQSDAATAGTAAGILAAHGASSAVRHSRRGTASGHDRVLANAVPRHPAFSSPNPARSSARMCRSV